MTRVRRKKSPIRSKHKLDNAPPTYQGQREGQQVFQTQDRLQSFHMEQNTL